MTNLENLTIETISNEQVEELANSIFAADNGYGTYDIEELNSTLNRLGIADEEGCFLDGLSGRADEVVELIMGIIC